MTIYKVGVMYKIGGGTMSSAAEEQGVGDKGGLPPKAGGKQPMTPHF